MNHAQRKFMKELAELMHKHASKIEVVKNYGEIEGIVFNIGGKRTEIITFEMSPTTIRKIATKGNNNE